MLDWNKDEAESLVNTMPKTEDSLSPRMKKSLAVFYLSSYIFLILISILSSTGSIGKGTNKDISNLHPTVLTPAGFTFSIWGLIFALQGCLVVHMMLSVFFWCSDTLYFFPFHFLLPIAWLGEAVWSFAFANDVMWLAFTIILMATISLGFYWSQLHHHISNEEFTFKAMNERRWGFFSSLIQYVIYSGSTSINFGWMLVATLASLFILFQSQGITLSAPVAVCFIALLCLFSTLTLFWRGDVFLPATHIWALFGVANGPNPEAVKIQSYVAIAYLFVALAVYLICSNCFKKSNTRELV